MAQDGSQELVEGGERKLGLGLDPASAEHVHIGCSVASVLEQGGLADPRLAA
jgi:hypothetical protein